LAFNESSVIGFKNCQAGVEETALGNDDDVESPRDLISTKNLSNQSFGAVSDHRAAKFPGRGDTESTRPLRGSCPGKDENRAVAAADFESALVNLLKIGSATNPLRPAEPHNGVPDR
jgi:hypothetical protein